MGHFNGFSRYFAEGSLLARLFFRFLVDPAELNTEGSARRRFFVSVAFAEGPVGAFRAYLVNAKKLNEDDMFDGHTDNTTRVHLATRIYQ